MSQRHPNIDFKAIANAALSRAGLLLGQWLPGGRRDGHEYKALNPTRADAKAGSFSININTGVWSDFATDDSGGDLISLYAYIHSLDQVDAARVVAGFAGIDLPDSCHPSSSTRTATVTPIRKDKTDVDSPPKEEKTPWCPLLPLPDAVSEPAPVAHYKRGKPGKVWTYRAADGAVNGYIYLFRTSEGGKETLPVCFAEHSETGKQEWRWMAFPEPRPLYGLDRLAKFPSAKVLLVEGEKCADAAAAVLDDFVVVCWPGGSQAVKKIDWSPLAGREVWAWADCDAQRERMTKQEKADGVDPISKPLLPENEQPGMRAMLHIRDAVLAINPDTKFHIVDIPAPGDKPPGWDVADMIVDGADGVALEKFIRNVRADVSVDSASVSDIADAKPKKKPKKTKDINWGWVSGLVENYALIYGTDTCIDIPKRMILKVNSLRLAAGNDYVKLWLGSDKRRMIVPEQLVFEPSGRCGKHDINLFDGLPMDAIKGDYEPIMELLYHLCADSAKTQDDVSAVVLWVLKWLALPLQKVGTKMRSALVFHGPQGAGKNLFFEIIAAMYGRYGLVVGQDQIEDKFNDWLSQKLFVIADEVVARQELYHQKNKLKSLITGETLQINTKMMPLRTESNHVNLAFLSNEHQPLALEVGDRRYFVVYTPPMRADDLYQRVADCIANGGIEAFYYYLTHLDLGGFSAFDLPPMTTAKQDLIELGLKPPERFVREWLAGNLPLPLRACSASQLYRVFRTWAGVNGERFPPNQTTFTKMINKAVQVMSRRAEKPDLLRYKVSKLAYPNNGQKSERVFIPAGQEPGEGVTEGAWLAEEIKQFEYLIRSFTEKTGGQAQ